jgi:hypothetical protein
VVITDVSRSMSLLDRLDKWVTVPETLQCSRNSITEGDVLLLEVGTVLRHVTTHGTCKITCVAWPYPIPAVVF